MLVGLEGSELSEMKVAGNPLKFSMYVDPVTRDSAPDLDENRESIVRELDALDS